MATITSTELMAMFPQLGFEMECDFVFDDGTFAVGMRGHYTPDELRMMLAQCEHANTVYNVCPRDAAGRQAIVEAHKTAKHEAELVEAADNMMHNCLDYWQVGDDMLYSYAGTESGSVEVWIVDTKDSCNMDDAEKVTLVKSYKNEA